MGGLGQTARVGIIASGTRTTQTITSGIETMTATTTTGGRGMSGGIKMHNPAASFLSHSSQSRSTPTVTTSTGQQRQSS